MAFFSSEHKDEYTALIFDIGSASIGAALVDIKDEEVPNVLCTSRVPLPFQREFNFDYFMHSMLGVLLQVSLNMQNNGLSKYKRRIDRVACVFSSPWFISQTRLLRIKREEHFTITRRFMADCIKNAKADFKSSKLAKEAESLGKEGILIEHHIIQTILDGYRVSHPYGKKAEDVAVALFMSLISEAVANKVEEVILKVFRVEHITFHSFALTSFLVVRDMYFEDDNFLLMDISGEVSEISLIYDDILYETASFPLGKNSIVRELSKEGRMLPEEAYSSLRLSADEHLNKENENSTVSFLEEKWLNGLREALSSLGDSLPLPQKLFITADKDTAVWFEKILKRGDFSDISYAKQPFHPIFLGNKELSSHVSFSSGSTFDLFIAMEALFLRRGV